MKCRTVAVRTGSFEYIVMFFFDSHKPSIKCDKSLDSGFVVNRGSRTRSPASWMGSETPRDTVAMLGHVFDHQVPLTRPSKAARVACSAFASYKVNEQRFTRGADPQSWKTCNLQHLEFQNFQKCMMLCTSAERQLTHETGV